ncbi:MAG: cytochrome C [Gammaproteobacteria bacterium]|nr:cytochrome C [Gammaproteobacteria bacterium]MCP5417943.1 cytochrome C [Chromatiaceae bacterium]
MKVTYSAIASNIQDPQGADFPPLASNSVTATSDNAAGIFKSNFWDPSTSNPGKSNGFATYEPLYPTGVLGMFPSTADLGLPAPDLVLLYFGPDRIPGTSDDFGADGLPGTGDEPLEAHQTAMPGITDPYNANVPQQFEGYVKDLPFFVDLPIGYVVENFKRFTAEGIPILPVDDAGRENPYPLMRVEARDKITDTVAAKIDVVLPVASEADCQQCHASQAVCDFAPEYTFVCDDVANSDGSIEFIEDAALAPGETPEQQVLNAAKINVLRLHDKKHGTALDDQRNIVCASCHYTPALDLAHLGPNDDNGKEQTQHISMSRAMHASHGNLNYQPQFDHLFPDMPPPGQRTAEQQQEILQETCYSCHPGKRTKCLRGAMGGGGIVCQDCHGQMAQVGNDFSAGLADGTGLDLNKRVPWASEPKCQSCHVGDVRQVATLQSSGLLEDVSVNSLDKQGNSDGLRLNMAYRLSDHSSNGGPENLALLDFVGSRFASNKPLYRLSGGDDGSGKGHGGLSCEGCHGSTHAIWPNANAWSNDNKAAMDLQGHSGTIIECTTCHDGNLGMTLNGPHGMHPVGDTEFAREHDDFAKANANACRACHGQNGQGSVLSRTATNRLLQAKEDHIQVSMPKGTPVGCGDCHENKLRNP